ncbi:MAG: iron dicitrate transport regulator FecR, partial [Caenispirillum sp.]|nr:iron dicitrate transport regulator FecR [Caenispirillum sp.]
VRVVGTAFSVRDGGGTGTDVSVAHGTVAVRSPRSGESVRLEAGRAAAVSPTGRVTAAAADPDGFAWVAGRIQFHDRPLRAVLADLDRYIPGFVVLLDDDLGDRPVSGSYRLDDPRAVVRALADVVGARVETVTDHLILVRS